MRRVRPLTVLLASVWVLRAVADSAPAPDLTGYRTVATARTTMLRPVSAGSSRQPGHFGVSVEADVSGALVVSLIEADSAAAKAGLRPGDRLLTVDGRKPSGVAGLRDLLADKMAGDLLSLRLLRDRQSFDLNVTLAAASHPLSAGGPRAVLGIQTVAAEPGVKIDRVTAGSPADSAGVKTGDILMRLDADEVNSSEKLRELVSLRVPGEKVKLALLRSGTALAVEVQLAPTRDDGLPSPARWDDRQLTVWRRDVYRLAVIPIAFPDVKPNEKVAAKDWDAALFSTGAYKGTSATGQTVYGSMNDYYLEQSCGKFHVTGKVFEPVAVGKKRAEYGTTPNRNALLNEACDQLLARDGGETLRGYDGIFFIYAGERVPTQRGGIFWPHRSTFSHHGRRWAYLICPEGGRQMSSISVIAHEFGHLLGLPDLYAKPDVPGSEGLGVWCTMSTGHGRDGKPLHFSAWCKEQLGWIRPAVIDPRERQKLILGPMLGSDRECYKVLLRSDGSEYLLLEDRQKRGFDRDLPAEGLLIWRVVDGRPVLEESHGIAGPDGPRRFLGSVPYPSPSNRAFTPYTTPSSRSEKPGAWPVHITNIRRLLDGRIAFDIGYEYF